MQVEGIYFIYGLCIMFYVMMAWFFWRKNSERLSRLVMVLMTVISLQCVKDLFFIDSLVYECERKWQVMTAVDMVAVPLYVFVLTELCRPGWLTWRKMALQEAPFVLLPLLLIATGRELFYDMEVVWAAVYGFVCATWTMINIPTYHAHLKTVFSYDENINLNWLRVILLSFFVILGLWIADCLVINLNIEGVYMIGTLLIWMCVCYFIYRHESVIDELTLAPLAGVGVVDMMRDESVSDLGRKIEELFAVDGVYLNPRLKLSDVALMVGTNRTYVSNYFNRDKGTSFFEYVNRRRIDRACELLMESSDRLEIIAERSGFNSLSTFHRVFMAFEGCTPSEFRARPQGGRCRGDI